MLTIEENRRLTEVEGDAPMGRLLRWYWHPIAASQELVDHPTKAVRIFGEDLVLFRDTSGNAGLIDRYCPHRRYSMVYGVPEPDGIRCAYHGWSFDAQGNCLEQPFEDLMRPDGRFREKVTIKSYPVQEMSGLIFAYFGPQPAPLLPQWEMLASENVVRHIELAVLPVNWMQARENQFDPIHVDWLHVYYGSYLKQRARGGKPLGSIARALGSRGRHVEMAFEPTRTGIVKRMRFENSTPDDHWWTTGRESVFPTIQNTGNQLQADIHWFVPIDNQQTLSIDCTFFQPAPGYRAPVQDFVPYHYVPLAVSGRDADNMPPTYDDDPLLLGVIQQDWLAWISQGPIAQRQYERLGESDRGIILFRKILQEQMALVEAGGEPSINVFRDPEDNRSIKLVKEGATDHDLQQYLPKTYIGARGQSKDNPSIGAVLQTWEDYFARRTQLAPV